MKGQTVIPRYMASLVWSLFVFDPVAQASSFRSLCVYTNWAQYRMEKGRFEPEDIDTSLCTHIVYAYAKPEGLRVRAMEWNDESNDWNVGMYVRVNKLKNRNPKLKVILSVGGLLSGSEVFWNIVPTAASRTTFIRNTANHLRINNFDGVNIDWDFLARDSLSILNKGNFQLLIQDFRKYFDVEYNISGRLPLILSVMVPGRKELIDRELQVAKLANYVDFVNLQTYESPMRFANYVDYNYPVYLNRKHGKIDTSGLTVVAINDRIAQYYVTLGMSKRKINIGIPTFGRSQNLTNPSHHSVLSRTDGLGNPGKYTREDGMLAYYEVCDMIEKGAKVYHEPFHDGVHAVLGSTWVGFESVNTITKKACYANLHGFGGLMFHSLDMDDFTGGSCKKGKYPLITAAHNAMTNATTAKCNSFYIKGAILKVTKKRPGTTTKSPKTTRHTVFAFNYTDREGDYIPERNLRIVCYYSIPTKSTRGKDILLPESIKTRMCTHISCNYGEVTGLSLTLATKNNSAAKTVEIMYRRIIHLKHKNPELKILLAVKGSSVGSASFLAGLRNASARFTFAENTAFFLRSRHLDGFDIVWEYSADNVNIPGNVLHFHLLMEDLKRAFDKESIVSGLPRLILSIALPAKRESIENGFDIIKITMFTDFVSLQTFNFHGSWEKFVGFNSPLAENPLQKQKDLLLDVTSFLRYYISVGGDVDRVNVGIPTYAVTFTLSNPEQHDVLSPASKPGRAGAFTATPGILAYYEVCQLIQGGANVVYVPHQHNKYLIKDDQWVGYDDKISVYEKVCHVYDMGVRGLMIYSLEFDDFTGGSCFQGRFPLLTTAYITLFDDMCPRINSSRYMASQANRLPIEGTYYLWMLLLWTFGNMATNISRCIRAFSRRKNIGRLHQEQN